MKQTAVELLEDGINKVLSHLPLEREDIKTLIQQAKAMEKEHIEKAWDDAYEKGTRDRIEKISNPVGNAEQYYNETFKSE